jgi:hypothetical protein
MALSPQYSWPEPDNSSLVKNGAQDIRALGDAIDTSVWNVGYGQAGKNKIINGDFALNQRAFTSTTSNGVYTFDRFQTSASDGTSTFSAQTFTLGAAPVSGYEGKNFINVQSASQTAASARTRMDQKIESVRTLAGQTATISFWAKAATGTPKVAVEIVQYFGTGGSPSANVNTVAGQVTLSTSWARYSVTVAVPSLSGKTTGTANDDFLQLALWTSAGTDFNSRTGSLGIQSATISLWGVQVEYGSKATPFQTASGNSIQGELAMCQRYYYQSASTVAYTPYGVGLWISGTTFQALVKLPVSMRIIPTLATSNALAANGSALSALTSVSVIAAQSSVDNAYVSATGTGTANYPAFLINNNTSGGYLGLTAEL